MRGDTDRGVGNPSRLHGAIRGVLEGTQSVSSAGTDYPTHTESDWGVSDERAPEQSTESDESAGRPHEDSERDLAFDSPPGDGDSPASGEAELPANSADGASSGWVTRYGEVRSAFIAGYRDAGGNPVYLEHFLNVVIPCESGWQPSAVSSGGHLGLAQFSERSWAVSGGGDWRDAHQQGANVARWVALTIDAASPGEREYVKLQQWSTWRGCPPRYVISEWP